MTDETTNRLHDGRPLITQTSDNGDTLTGWPEVASEAIRSINHLTQTGAIPAPVVYEVLGDLTQVGFRLNQALTQLRDGLTRSLDEVKVEISDGSVDPAWSVDETTALLGQAATAASALGQALDAAQEEIARWRYNDQP